VLQFWVGAAASLVMLAFMLLGTGLDWSLARWDMPATHEWFWLATAGLLAAFAHVLIAMAFARSDASLLAPLQYLEIFGATLLGWLIFAEWPDAFTILGGLIIIAAAEPIAAFMIDDPEVIRHTVAFINYQMTKQWNQLCHLFPSAIDNCHGNLGPFVVTITYQPRRNP
jgi:uncharacterized membrane protein